MITVIALFGTAITLGIFGVCVEIEQTREQILRELRRMRR